MTWIFVALSGYFLNALASLFDKFLLHERIPKPSVYAFYVSMFSLFALLFLPFAEKMGGFNFYGWKLFGLSILSGVLFEYCLIAFYTAVKENEISRVSPMVLGVVSPLALLAFSAILLGERLETWSFLAFVCLVGGGLLISLEFPLSNRKLFKGFWWTLVAGVLMALSFVILKYTFNQENFVSAFVWNRLGSFLGGLSFLLFAKFRKEILANILCTKVGCPSARKSFTVFLFVINKSLAGLAMLIINYAFSIGSVALVQSLGSAQFAFLLLMVTPLSFKYPQMFKEKQSVGGWVQKIGVVLLITLGLVFVSLEGKAVL